MDKESFLLNLNRKLSQGLDIYQMTLNLWDYNQLKLKRVQKFTSYPP
jgi:hypothetical protein